MEIFALIYIFLVIFSYAAILGLVTDSNIFNNKYHMILIAIFGIMTILPILNIVPIVIYILVLIRQKD